MLRASPRRLPVLFAVLCFCRGEDPGSRSETLQDDSVAVDQFFQPQIQESEGEIPYQDSAAVGGWRGSVGCNQTSEGPFSAVSTPNIAMEALCLSIFRDLAFALLQIQNVQFFVSSQFFMRTSLKGTPKRPCLLGRMNQPSQKFSEFSGVVAFI